MMGKHWTLGYQPDNGAIEAHWFNAAQTNPAELWNLDNLAKEVDQAYMPFEPASKGAKVNARENYLLETVSNQGLYFR